VIRISRSRVRVCPKRALPFQSRATWAPGSANAAGQTRSASRPPKPRQSKLRQTQRRRVEPRPAEPGRAEPRLAELGRAEPRLAELGRAEPRPAESGRAEPRQAESGRAEPRQVERRPAEPRWRTVDLALRQIAARRAALDAEEARWLREAEELQIWRPLGMVSA